MSSLKNIYTMVSMPLLIYDNELDEEWNVHYLFNIIGMTIFGIDVYQKPIWVIKDYGLFNISFLNFSRLSVLFKLIKFVYFSLNWANIYYENYCMLPFWRNIDERFLSTYYLLLPDIAKMHGLFIPPLASFHTTKKKKTRKRGRCLINYVRHSKIIFV